MGHWNLWESKYKLNNDDSAMTYDMPFGGIGPRQTYQFGLNYGDKNLNGTNNLGWCDINKITWNWRTDQYQNEIYF